MSSEGNARRTIWRAGEAAVEIIDQTALPHETRTARLATAEDAAEAIAVMRVRAADPPRPRMSRVASKPSITGIWQSMSTRSKV